MNENTETFKVYVLLKGLCLDFYVPLFLLSHYVCLLKSSKTEGKTYCTELQTESRGIGKGTNSKIKIKWEEHYKYLRGPIYYIPIGTTKLNSKDLEKLKNFAENSENGFNGKDYDIMDNNCQHWVKCFIEKIRFENPSWINPSILSIAVQPKCLFNMNDENNKNKYEEIKNNFIKLHTENINELSKLIKSCKKPEHMEIEELTIEENTAKAIIDTTYLQLKDILEKNPTLREQFGPYVAYSLLFVIGGILWNFILKI